MAGRTPYSAARTDSLIIRAIARGDLPAPVTDLAIPDYGKELLGKCWSPDPILRPTAGLCVEVLSRRPASLFEACCYVSVDDIPSDYKTEGDGWHAIHNVAFSGTYDMTFQSVWRHMEPMFVSAHACIESLTHTHLLGSINCPPMANTSPSRRIRV